MNKLLMTIAVVGLLCGGGQVAQAQPVAPEDLRPGFIYVGTVGDGGWTLANDIGRKEADRLFPGVVSMVAESVAEGPELMMVIERMITNGKSRLIIGNSLGYGDFMLAAAAKYPEIKFVHISGNQRADNLSTYFGRLYQARFLAGLVAGHMSKSGSIGYVAAFPVPEVLRGINAFTLGARTVNPDATVKVVWLNSWYDMALERDLTKGLIDKGRDVIAMHCDTGQVPRVCEEAGVYVIGNNFDMSAYAPTMHLTAPVWHWGVLYAHAYEQVINGTWRSEDLWWGLKEGAVALAPFGNMVPQEARNMVETYKEYIISGKFAVFHGPIRDNLGNLRVEEGIRLEDDELLAFDWFVAGVVSD